MSYWTGSETDIIAAEAQAAAIVTAIPETRDGEDLPQAEWITRRWAIPAETATAGVWAIPAYPGMDIPSGCAVAESVTWPETTYT